MTPIALVGEAYGVNEEKINAPFVGSSGLELLRMLDEAGVITLTSTDSDYIREYWRRTDPHLLDMVWRLHPEVRRYNVFHLHPEGNNIETLCGPRSEAIPGYPALVKGKFVHARYESHLYDLADEINTLDPDLIIALGNTPLWALCGTTGISKLRGTTRLSTHVVRDFKTLPTYHPAAVLRQWELRPLTVIDLGKAKREAGFAEIRRPEREIWIEPTIADIERFINEHVIPGNLLSCDIETAGNQVTCIGFAPSERIAIVIPFLDERKPGRNYWPDRTSELTAWELVRAILEDRSIPKLFHNGLYDIAFLYRSMKIRVYGATEDTMLLHHALQPESLKGLGFLGSVYCDEGAWKHEHRVSTIKREA